MDSPVDRKSFKKLGSTLYVLDEDFYPETWKDDQQMSVLLYTFRPRQVNPEHYDQKMKFWMELIENYCEYKGSSTVSIQELKNVFKRKGTAPYCLQDVLNQMSDCGNIVAKDEFMQQQKSYAGWAVDALVWKPLSWGIGKIKSKLVSSSDDEQTIFVVKSAVAKQAKLLQQHVRSRHSFNNIISMDDLMSGADEIEGVSLDGILIALHHLSNVERSVYIEENLTVTDSTPHHKLLLKFCEPHQQVLPITEIERSVYNLEQTEKFLHKTIDKKEEQLNAVLKQVRELLRDGKKQIAKTYLRKKHMMEADLVKSVNVLDNVQTMLLRVHSSKSDKEIMNTYKMGSDAIKIAFAENGINIDKVHDVIEDMQEIYQDQEDYEAAISEPLRGAKDVDDAELEKELMDMITSTEIDLNKNVGGAGGVIPKTEEDKKIEEMNLLDRELEMRLMRLRSDAMIQDAPQVTRKNPRTGLTQM